MRRLLVRLSAAAAAAGLATAGLVAAAVPAQAAACSGTTGVTVVIDTGSSLSTSCASIGGSAMSALKAVSSVVSPQRYPGQVVCRINGTPASDPCIDMPPASAYWAFFHAPRGGSWTYSSLGVASYTPKAGSVIGFRFGSGQQPRSAPPAKTVTSTPKPTSKPKPTTAAPKPTSKPRSTSGTTAGSGSTATKRPTAPPTSGAKGTATPEPGASASAGSSTAPTPTASATTSGAATASPGPEGSATPLAAAPTSTEARDDGNGTGTLVTGGALVVLVAAGAGVVAWRRRT